MHENNEIHRAAACALFAHLTGAERVRAEMDFDWACDRGTNPYNDVHPELAFEWEDWQALSAAAEADEFRHHWVFGLLEEVALERARAAGLEQRTRRKEVPRDGDFVLAELDWETLFLLELGATLSRTAPFARSPGDVG